VLDQITPVLLTYNEAENIGRTLSRLAWAKDIVVVDSGSTDATRAILAGVPQVRVFTRPFDNLVNQWTYATHETGIATPWLLRLDADYQLTDTLLAELAQLDPDRAVSAYCIAFDYAIFSRKLMASLYPPKPILLRAGEFLVEDKGHTEKWTVKGTVLALKARVVHDDWKPTESWINSQGRYMRRELEMLRVRRTGLAGWLRLKPPLMPMAVFLYCLFAKGLILNGRAGLFYALQRMLAEAVLSLMVLEDKLRDKTSTRGGSGRDSDD
jgi:glycosyltransferase involved in cell wall biosynthesis